jgi:CubicO group peptidase (beta-lactamase class C family)
MKPILIFLFIFQIPFLWAQEKDWNLFRELKLDSVCRSYLSAYKIPGFAIGISKNGKTLYAKGFGVKNIATQELISSTSLFHMASVSKPFVATAILQLVEQGRIVLDSPLINYLPYFKLRSANYNKITIRQMLTHSSGIPDVVDYEWDKPHYDDGAAERYVRSLSSLTLDFEPGYDVAYSNTAFDILGDVIAKVSGVPFETYLRINVLEPCGMVNSTFLRAEANKDLVTSPHVMNKNGEVAVSMVYPYNRCHAPSSTLHSNVDDMLKWACRNLNPGSQCGDPILSNTSYRLLVGPQREFDSYVDVALSWFVYSNDEQTYISHNGGDTGYTTHISIFPEDSVSIVVMSNCDFFPLLQTVSSAYRILYGKKLSKDPVQSAIVR